MINDQLTRLSGTLVAGVDTPQTLTLTATTVYYSENALDLRNPTNVSGGTTTTQMRDIGEGEDLFAVLTVATNTTLGNGVTIDVIMSDDLAATNAIVVGTFGVLTTTAVTGDLGVAGRNFVARINPRLRSLGTTYRYLQIRYTNGTTTAMGQGKVYVDIVTDIYDSQKFYGSGFTVT
jgi:hypothetical protein